MSRTPRMSRLSRVSLTCRNAAALALATGVLAVALPSARAQQAESAAKGKPAAGGTAGAGTPKAPVESYPVHPDAVRQEGVPQGKVTQMPKWTDSKVFPNTERDWWVYVPAQYDGKTPACVMVFQDGGGPVSEKGDWKVPIVFDNLIHKKEMPVTIGIFINPGNDVSKNPPVVPGRPLKAGEKPPVRRGASNRSFEYDTLSDAYSKFLLDEILPAVAKDYKLTDDPNGRAISGSSSGGICAFTVAWERPDAFRKVASSVGSFTGIAYRPAKDGKPMQPGGDLYPTLIRKNPVKPIRVFLQDGRNDLDNDHGNWPLANQQMEKALLYANRKADEAKTEGKGGADPKGADAGAGKADGPRYDVKFVFGEGAHNGKHAGAIFPDTLKWLWRDYPGVKGAPAAAAQ
jgi:enterochelin esterase-like enzyme